MNNKLIVGLVVLILGFGVGWYFFQNQIINSSLPINRQAELFPTEAVEPTQSNAEPMEKGRIKRANITYGAGGFNPKTVVVSVGTTVVWTNQSDSEMWVASAQHPTHQLLPGFDALKGFARGEFYEYTFEKIGSWKYHNHLNASDFGTVEVTR